KIVLGIVLVCALCVANPNACKNPAWYTRFCLLLQELHPEHLYRTSASPNMNDAAFSTSECTADNTTYRLRIKNRAAIAMLMPAVHLMHHIWNGVAWVTEDISGEEKVTNYQIVCHFRLIPRKNGDFWKKVLQIKISNN
ncbi:unnamed protein product, partial [Onchocerca flexuosa]|uniref:Salivary secreted protein n=1 Tax=Onchocerca flexuosa TaxID=387005 RepID=A0A183HEN2_9BILA